MALEYNGTLDYSGENIEELFIQPAEVMMLPEGVTIWTTVDNAKNLTYLGIADDNVYKRTKGYMGGDSGALIPVRIVCERFKKEMSLDLDTYLDRVQRRLLANNPGFDIGDLDGTDIEEAETGILLEATMRGLIKNMWLGDKSKTHGSGGNYVTGDSSTSFSDGDGDRRYNAIDGIWTAIVASQSETGGEKVKLYALTNSDVNSDQSLKDDVALAYFKKMYRNADRILKSIPAVELRIYATDEFRENYEDTLSDSDSLDSSRTALVDGIVRLTYKGIPIVPMPIETALEADFGNSKRHRAILSTPGNLFMLFGLGTHTDARIWTNLDEEERRSRLNFEFNAGFIHPQLITGTWGENA